MKLADIRPQHLNLLYEQLSQPEEISQIWEALENEPIKWKTMAHLFLVTGCRRGEVLGLKWSKVDWENKQIYIDCNLLYRKELGIYEDTPKTKGSVRYIRLPDQTMELLAEYRKLYKQKNVSATVWRM